MRHDLKKMIDNLKVIVCNKLILQLTFKAALSVTFDILILELMFLFFKNKVKS